jgi:hypothetical protein
MSIDRNCRSPALLGRLKAITTDNRLTILGIIRSGPNVVKTPTPVGECLARLATARANRRPLDAHLRPRSQHQERYSYWPMWFSCWHPREEQARRSTLVAQRVLTRNTD